MEEELEADLDPLFPGPGGGGLSFPGPQEVFSDQSIQPSLGKPVKHAT
jgi:hypothetical protein